MAEVLHTVPLKALSNQPTALILHGVGIGVVGQSSPVKIGTTTIQATAFSTGLLSASIPAAALAQAGSFSVSVTPPGGSSTDADPIEVIPPVSSPPSSNYDETLEIFSDDTGLLIKCFTDEAEDELNRSIHRGIDASTPQQVEAVVLAHNLRQDDLAALFQGRLNEIAAPILASVSPADGALYRIALDKMRESSVVMIEKVRNTLKEEGKHILDAIRDTK